MNKVRVEVPDYNISPDKIIGYQKIGLRMISDINLDDNF